MTWGTVTILVLAIIGIFVVVPIILRLIGFGVKLILKLIFYTLITIGIVFVIMWIGDTYFDTHMFDWLDHITTAMPPLSIA